MTLYWPLGVPRAVRRVARAGVPSPGRGFNPNSQPRAHNWPRTTIIQRPEPAPRNPVKTCQPVTPERAARAKGQCLSQKTLPHNVHYVKLAWLQGVRGTGRGGALAFVQAGPSERLSSQPHRFLPRFKVQGDSPSGQDRVSRPWAGGILLLWHKESHE